MGEGSATVSIYGAPNFGGKAIAQRSGKTAALKTDMADRLEVGKKYDMYIKIRDIDEEDYEFVSAAEIK